MVTIASVYWGKLVTRRPFRTRKNKGFNTTFELAAVPKIGDPPSTCIVEAAWDLKYEPTYGPVSERGSYTASMVLPRTRKGDVLESMDEDASAREVARDILYEWSREGVGHAEAGLGKGIWLCKAATPSDEEIAAATEGQLRWARYLIDVADSNWLTGKRNLVTGFYRAAANWIGEEREWLHPAATSSVMACPFCGKQTPAAVPVCQNCDRVHNPALMKRIEEQLGGIQERIAAVEETLPQEAAEEVTEDDILERPSQVAKRDKMAYIKEKVAEREPRPEHVEA